MPIKVEQITHHGEVISDCDQTFNRRSIIELLNSQSIFNNSNSSIPYLCEHKNHKITLLVKNISYLGIPHKVYKKRIQIPSKWKSLLQKQFTFLMGVYHYEEQILFCLFNTKNYQNNRLNNSSAHIHTIDLLKAKEKGIFQKKDKNNNLLTVFTPENLNTVFNSLLSDDNSFIDEEVVMFSEYASSLNKEWHGIDCYKEMQDNNYNNAYQAEWAGFYNEYMFEKYLNRNLVARELCKKISQKTSDTIDLDLQFIRMNCYGDLKTHTIGNDLPGNDKKMIFQALNECDKIWYLVLSHKTIKDNRCDGVVTEFWNKSLNTNKGKKKALDSYSSRMKNTVLLESISILEINHSNKCHLSDFNQGINSNGSKRNPKIKIKKSELTNDNFVIYREFL